MGEGEEEEERPEGRDQRRSVEQAHVDVDAGKTEVCRCKDGSIVCRRRSVFVLVVAVVVVGCAWGGCRRKKSKARFLFSRFLVKFEEENNIGLGERLTSANRTCT